MSERSRSEPWFTPIETPPQDDAFVSAAKDVGAEGVFSADDCGPLAPGYTAMVVNSAMLDKSITFQLNDGNGEVMTIAEDTICIHVADGKVKIDIATGKVDLLGLNNTRRDDCDTAAIKAALAERTAIVEWLQQRGRRVHQIGLHNGLGECIARAEHLEGGD